MRRFFAQVRRQVDDRNGLERTLSHANTAANAQLLGDGGNLVTRRDLDAKLACPDDGAIFFALLLATLRLALVIVHDGDSREVLRLVRLLPFQLGRHFEGEKEKADLASVHVFCFLFSQ